METQERLSPEPDGPFASSELTPDDEKIVGAVGQALEDGLALARWWEAVDLNQGYEETFELSRTRNRPDTSFGFFGEVELADRTLDVMGNVQEMFYDRAKTPATPTSEAPPASEVPTAEELNLQNYPEWLREQVREYVLHYFMRASDFSQPDSYPDEDLPDPPAYLKPLAWCPTSADGRQGFGFEQVYYKRASDGRVGKFADDERFRVVDMRRIGEEFEWIVLKVNIFDFRFSVAPFGAGGPQLVVPMTEASHVVVHKGFLLDDSDPPDGDLGQYGIGYAFVREQGDSVLAYGPGQFDAAFQVIRFHVRPGGEIHSRMAFVANRPEKVVDVSLDPVTWGFRMADMMTPSRGAGLLRPMRRAFESLPRPGGVDLVSSYISFANMVTGGMASRELCISRDQLEKDFLLQHFTQHYNTLAGSLVTWRQIPDWLDREALPDWVLTGKG
ncbi:MAG: hypothetical protein AAGN66_10800 [Acidobacteriota bacterium]